MYDFFISFKFLLGKVTAEYKTENYQSTNNSLEFQ